MLNNSIKQSTTTHILENDDIITNEIWANDNEIYSFYDFGDMVKKSTYEVPETIKAKVYPDNYVEIIDFVPRDSRPEFWVNILSDFIIYCKKMKYDKISTTLAVVGIHMPAELMHFYQNNGFEFLKQPDRTVVICELMLS